MKVINVVGARPNFMKIAPVLEEMKKFPGCFTPLLVHTGQHYDENMSKAFFKDLELPQPDIYLGVGSGTHSEQTAKIMVEFEKIILKEHPDLVDLRAKLGIYGILGDNDFSAMQDILELKIALDNIGVHILDDESVRIPVKEKGGIQIIGLTKQRLSQEILRKAYLGVNLSEPKIVLTHYPEIMDSGYIYPGNADLVLSGGTHGGQVGLKFIRDFFSSATDIHYIAGLYQVNEVPLYVNRGIGDVGDMQADTVRFFCRPEITVITLTQQ